MSIPIAVRWLVRREFVVLVRDLQTPLPEIPTCGPARWTLLAEPDLPHLLALNPALAERELQQRLQSGQLCLLCWIDGSLAHYRWEAAGPSYLSYLGLIFRPLEGDLLVTEVYTHSAFRRRGIDSAGSIAALHRARDLGYRRSIALAAWWNAPALRISRDKTGRRVAGTVGYWSVGLGRYPFATGEVSLDDLGNVHVLPAPQGRPSSHKSGSYPVIAAPRS